MSKKLDDGYGGTLTRKHEEAMERQGESDTKQPASPTTHTTPKMVTRKVSIIHDATRQQFEALHKAGSEKFGGAWLAVNMAITEHAQSRTDISDPAIKELLSLCALRILMRLRAEGYLLSSASRPEPYKDQPHA